MPSACDSTNWAMFVRTSDRGEPAKINFCRVRTDSVENSPDSPFASAKAPTVDCTGRFMKRRSHAPSSGEDTHYFRPGQTKLPEVVCAQKTKTMARTIDRRPIVPIKNQNLLEL